MIFPMKFIKTAQYHHATDNMRHLMFLRYFPWKPPKRLSTMMLQITDFICIYTQTLLHTDTLTHRSFFTQMLLHTDPLTHRCLYTQTLLHTNTFTQRPFYTQKLLHKDAFTYRHFYTQTLLHTLELKQLCEFWSGMHRSWQRHQTIKTNPSRVQ